MVNSNDPAAFDKQKRRYGFCPYRRFFLSTFKVAHELHQIFAFQVCFVRVQIAPVELEEMVAHDLN